MSREKPTELSAGACTSAGESVESQERTRAHSDVLIAGPARIRGEAGYAKREDDMRETDAQAYAYVYSLRVELGQEVHDMNEQKCDGLPTRRIAGRVPRMSTTPAADVALPPLRYSCVESIDGRRQSAALVAASMVEGEGQSQRARRFCLLDARWALGRTSALPDLGWVRGNRVLPRRALRASLANFSGR